MKGGKTEMMPRVSLVVRGARPGASRHRGLAGGQWSVVGTFGRHGQDSDSGGGRLMKNKAR